jgi:outer membrane cobalamin receptor
MGWGTYSNSPTAYLGLPPQGNGNLGTLGIIQREIRGERSGLDAPFLRTVFLQHDYTPNDKFSLMGRVVYRETGIGDESYLYITTNGTRLIRLMIASYSNRVSGEAVANYAPAKNHRFSAGVQYTQDNVEQGARRSTIDVNTIYLMDGRDTVLNLRSTYLPRLFDIRNNFGSYLQYNLSTDFLVKTSVTLGARYDRNSYFGDAFSPRVSIVNQPSKKLTLKLHFGTAFRAPTNLEIYQTPPTSGFQLKQERIKTYELNFIYAHSRKIQFQVNGFRNELNDVIILGNLAGFVPDKNPGVLKINGAEAILTAILTGNLSGYFNFTFQDGRGRNLNTGFSGRLPGIARVKGNAGITWHFEDYVTFTMTGNWVGERRSPRTSPYGKVKGYLLANCVISTSKIFRNMVTASLNIRNLFDKKWLDPGFRTADGLVYSTVLEQPGMNGFFKLAVNF